MYVQGRTYIYCMHTYAHACTRCAHIYTIAMQLESMVIYRCLKKYHKGILSVKILLIIGTACYTEDVHGLIGSSKSTSELSSCTYYFHNITQYITVATCSIYFQYNMVRVEFKKDTERNLKKTLRTRHQQIIKYIKKTLCTRHQQIIKNHN